MVTCAIDRLYPATSDYNFNMRWGPSYEKSSRFSNGDFTYGYAVRETRTLKRADNGTLVNCTVVPRYGKTVSEVRTLIVDCKYNTCKSYFKH